MVVVLSAIAAVEWAQEFAVWAHGKQVDKGGRPYENHLRAVGDIAVGLQEKKYVEYCDTLYNLRTAGWLHDVVEDTTATSPSGIVTYAMLKDEGFNDAVLKMVEAITKRPSEQQSVYLARLILAGRGAMLLKLADLYHNTEIPRLKELDGNTQVRLLTKYTKAIGALESILVVSDGVRRAWFLRQYLAKLKAQGFKEYATSTYTSYGSDYYSSASGSWVSSARTDLADVYDTRQGKMVRPISLIGGASWDGWYPEAPDGHLRRAPVDGKGNFIIPSDDKIFRETPKADAAKSQQLALPAVQERAANPSCKYPAVHAPACECGKPKPSYQPSVDYLAQKAATGQ